MKNWTLLFASIMLCFISCGQSRNKDSAGVGTEGVTCLVLGYDSIIYYTGSSKQMQDVNKGKMTDTTFMNAMFEKIKDDGLSLTIKPGGGADMLGNFQEVVNLANLHEVDRRLVDSGDENEAKAFGFVTPPMVKDAMNGVSHPLKLDLPRDEPDTPNAVSKFPKVSQLVVLFGDKGIYAYMGGYFTKGKKYTYQELIDMLKEKRSDKDFSVVIKPSASSTYKNTVDMLDAMHIAEIKHYALVDITKEEESYLHQLGQD
jgi:biopolymer transport protein ExbD